MLSTYYKNDWFCFKKYLEYNILWEDEKSNHLQMPILEDFLFFSEIWLTTCHRSLFCKLWFGWGLRVFFVGSNKQNLWRFRCCAPADVLSWERAFDRCHPYCLFVFSPTHPPVTCGKAFFASFAPPPIILLLRTYLDPIIVQNLIDLENGARLELLLLSTDVLWRTRCHDWRHKFPQISNWHWSPGSTDISQFLFFSKQKTSNKEHKTATRDKKTHKSVVTSL